jgi:hypothetical protein
MKSLLLAAALLCAAAVPALADTWTAVYGNTITSTYSDGRVVKVYVNADHSYSVVLPDGKTLNGTWADAGGQSCFTLSSGGTPSCFPIKEYKVGDTFSGTDSTGSFTGVISAGR